MPGLPLRLAAPEELGPVAHQVADDLRRALDVAPEVTLYAVNRHVDFTPYRTTFELAECRVGSEHWSRR